MKVIRAGAMFLLAAVAAEPCSYTPLRALWAKAPGSKSELFAFERNGLVGFIDRHGKVRINPSIDARIQDVGDFSNGRARIGDQGYIDESGDWIIRQRFEWNADYSDDVARVAVSGPTGHILSLSGSIIAQIPFLQVGQFLEGLATYEAEGKPGIRRFEPGNFVYRDFPGLKGFIDKTGTITIKPVFADVGSFSGGLARAVLDGYCQRVTDDGYGEGTPTTGFASSCGGAPADARLYCKAGFINSQGTFAIKPDFEAVQDFREGLAAVRTFGKWGFVNPQGQIMIAPQFDQTQPFSEGLAAVRLNGKWGFIDSGGRWAIPPRFEDVEPFSDSLAIVQDGGQPFYIDRRGSTKITGFFTEGTPFVNGLAAVLITGKQVAYIDHIGRIVFRYFRH